MYQLFNIIFATFFIIVATSGQSLAPLIKFENVTIIEDEYLVMLHKEYSLVSHFEHIGLDLSEVSSKFRAIPLINGYSARLTADVVHNIRSDSGVRVVEHNFMIKGMEPMSTGNATIPMDDSGLNKRWSYYYQTQPWHIAMLTAGKKLSVPLPDQSTVVSSFHSRNSVDTSSFLSRHTSKVGDKALTCMYLTLVCGSLIRFSRGVAQ